MSIQRSVQIFVMMNLPVSSNTETIIPRMVYRFVAEEELVIIQLEISPGTGERVTESLVNEELGR